MNSYSKKLQAVIRALSAVGAELAGVLRGDVEYCTEHARRAKNLGSTWSVTEAMDIGNDVIIRFDQALDFQDWPAFIVRVNKVTGQISAKAA